MAVEAVDIQEVARARKVLEKVRYEEKMAQGAVLGKITTHR